MSAPEAGVFFDRGTGEFRFGIDATEAWTLAEGEKQVLLTAADEEGNWKTWGSSAFFVEPTYEPSLADVRAARESWAARILPIFTTYEDFVSNQVFDESAFTSIGMDIEALTLIVQAAEGVLGDPTTSSWRTTGTDLETALDDLLLHDPTGVPAEEWHYRELFVNQLGWFSTLLESAHDLNIGAESPGPPAAWDQFTDQRLALIDYYDHTFAQADWTTGSNPLGQPTATWEGRIWQDTDAPHLGTLTTYEPGSVIPNSGSSGSPVWLVEVTFTDTDEDGDQDTMEITGLRDVDLTGPVEAIADTSSYGHLVTPLRHVFETRAICLSGF